MAWCLALMPRANQCIASGASCQCLWIRCTLANVANAPIFSHVSLRPRPLQQLWILEGWTMPLKSWLEAFYKSHCPKSPQKIQLPKMWLSESQTWGFFFFAFVKIENHWNTMRKTCFNLKINGSTEDLLERGAQDGQQRRQHDEPLVHCRASRHSDGRWMPSLVTRIARHWWICHRMKHDRWHRQIAAHADACHKMIHLHSTCQKFFCVCFLINCFDERIWTWLVQVAVPLGCMRVCDFNRLCKNRCQLLSCYVHVGTCREVY